MSFTIANLKVRDFRSYVRFDLELGELLTVIVGPNAVGKTNLVEALQLVTEADSFRKPVWSELVRWGQPAASVEIVALDGQRVHDVTMEVNAQGRRTYLVNGKAKRSVSDVRGTIACVLFTPEDLRLVKESAERRRAALDSIGGQLSKTYSLLKAEYDRVVRHRNVLLKNDLVTDDEMAPWDERLVSLGARLVGHRRGLFGRMAPEIARVYGRLSEDGPLEVRYVPSWVRDGVASDEDDPAEAMERLLESKRDEERVRRSTQAGPHRDEIEFLLAGRSARAYASQGQQRTIALAFKLAEVAVVKEVSGTKPLLLLDDVMSELDDRRRDALTRLVGQTAQTVITTTDTGHFGSDLLNEATVVTLG